MNQELHEVMKIISMQESFDMKTGSSGSRRGKPSATWTGASFEVRKGSRMLVVAAVTQGEEFHVLVELDSVTHWNR